jgi:predicted phosphoribosyltransferase
MSLTPGYFWAIGQFYEDFRQIEDEEAVELLRRFYDERTAVKTSTAP